MNKQKFEEAIKQKVLDFLDPLDGGFNDFVVKMVKEYEIENDEKIEDAVSYQLHCDHAYVTAVNELKILIDKLTQDN
jgi:uncharacterized protein (UPF0297 family)